MNLRGSKTFTILSLTLVLLIVGLAVNNFSAKTASKEEITIGINTIARTLDPNATEGSPEFRVAANIFDPLVRRSAEGKLEPALATSWSRKDLKTWSFQLRKGVEYHNGNDFTAADVAYTFERVQDPTKTEVAFISKLVEEIRTVGKYEIEIETKDPVPYFVNQLAHLYILDKQSSEARSKGEIANDPIGTGPYEVVEWTRGQEIIFEADENYWGEKPEVKKVVYREIADAMTRVAALFGGEIDILLGVPVELFDKVKNRSGIKTIKTPSRRIIYLGLSGRKGFPTANTKVRKALYMAINEQEIVEKIMNGLAIPASQMFDKHMTGYNSEIERLQYDPEKAKELLAEAGYPEGFEITLDSTNDRYMNDAQIAEAVVRYWQKIGIDAELAARTASQHGPLVANHNTNCYLLGWSESSYSGLALLSSMFHTPEEGYGTWNGGDYSNELLDTFIESGSKILNNNLRREYVEWVNKYAMKELVVYIPLHYQVDLYAVREEAGVSFPARPDKWLLFNEIEVTS